MTDFANLAQTGGGILAIGGTAGVGAVVVAMKVWRYLRKELRADTNEAQQEAYNKRTTDRVAELENKNAALNDKVSALSMQIGELSGELKAERARVSDLTTNKDYWKDRAMALEKKVTELDAGIDAITLYAVNTDARLAIVNGELDSKSVIINPIGSIPEFIRHRMELVAKNAITNTFTPPACRVPLDQI